jgi:hypothetical protein
LALQTHDHAVEARGDTTTLNREHHVLQQALSVAAAKAKLTGLVIAAAAVGGTAVAAGSTAFVPTSGEDTVVTAPTDTPSPEVVPTTDPTPEAADVTPEATRTPLPCPSDVANHGAYVSQVAHDKTLKGREHGKAVSEAAHSDCGKPDGAAADAESSDAPEVEATEAPETPDADDADESGDTQKPEAAQKHGKGHQRG